MNDYDRSLYKVVIFKHDSWIPVTELLSEEEAKKEYFEIYYNDDPDYYNIKVRLLDDFGKYYHVTFDIVESLVEA